MATVINARPAPARPLHGGGSGRAAAPSAAIPLAARGLSSRSRLSSSSASQLAHRQTGRRGSIKPLRASGPVALSEKITDDLVFPDLKVVTYSAKPYVRESFEPLVKKHFPGSVFYEAPLNIETTNLSEGADVVVLFVNDTASPEIIKELAANGVKHIAMRCAGFDRVDLAAAADAGITVTRVPSYSPVSIAEHAVALLMTLNRKLHRVANRIREGNFTLSGLQGFEVFGKTVGVIGTGKIGQAFCRIMKLGFNCRVVAYDKFPNKAMKDIGVEYMELEDMLPLADIVSLFCPLMDSTYHIINEENIRTMKSGVFLINCSRGGLVDTAALLAALREGHIGAAGLDVYEKETSLFFNDFSTSGKFNSKTWDGMFAELEVLPNVLVSPHSAFLTYEALENITETVVENLAEYAQGKPLTNQVTATPKVVSSVSEMTSEVPASKA